MDSAPTTPPPAPCTIDGLADDVIAVMDAAGIDRWKRIRGSIVGCTPAGYTGCAQAIGNFDFTGRLGTVKTPTLVVCGTDDPSTAPGESRHIASLFPNGSYDDFQGAKHLPNVEQPDAFNRVPLKWLAAHQ